MQRIEHQLGPTVRPLMPGNLLRAGEDHNCLDEALHDDLTEAVSRRHGVIVASIADQRCRRHTRRPDLAGLEWSKRELPERSNISLKPHSDGPAVATRAFRPPRPAIGR